MVSIIECVKKGRDYGMEHFWLVYLSLIFFVFVFSLLVLLGSLAVITYLLFPFFVREDCYHPIIFFKKRKIRRQACMHDFTLYLSRCKY